MELASVPNLSRSPLKSAEPARKAQIGRNNCVLYCSTLYGSICVCVWGGGGGGEGGSDSIVTAASMGQDLGHFIDCADFLPLTSYISPHSNLPLCGDSLYF